MLPLFLFCTFISYIQLKFQVIRIPRAATFRRGQYPAECGVTRDIGISFSNRFFR